MDALGRSDWDPSIELLGRSLRSLRRRRAAERLIQVFSLSVALDVVLEVLSLGGAWWTGQAIYLPLFFLLPLTVMLLRDLPRFRLAACALELDRRFGLGERLHSFVVYRATAGLPPALLAAHASRALQSIDLGAITRALRPRFPLLLVAVLPLYFGFAYARSVALGPEPLLRAPPWAREASVPSLGPGGDAAAPGAAGPASGLDSPSSEASAEAAEPREAEGSRPGGDPADESRDDRPQGPGGTSDAAGAPTQPSGATAGTPQAPERIASIPVTQEVSEAVPPSLAAMAGREVDAFPDAAHLLPLLSGQGRRGAGQGEPALEDLAGVDVRRYPARYRIQMARYYTELLKWKASQ